MASWGLLQGLGEGLQQAGQLWDARRKEKLAQELEKQREERAEQRQIARERRQAEQAENTIASYRPVLDDDGVLWMQGVNAAGAPKGERRLADKAEIQNFRQQQERDRLSLDSLIADATIKKFRAGRLPTEAAQDDELFGLNRRSLEADIAAKYALARERDSKATKGASGETLTERDYIDYVLDNGSHLVKQYVGSEANPGVLGADEVDEIAARAARLAVAEGRDPIAIFRGMLGDAASLKRPAKRKEGEVARPRFMGDY